MAAAVCGGRSPGQIYRRGMPGFFLWQRRYAGYVGVTLVSDLSDLSDLSDKMGVPVFALMSYAVASHVIPRGFAVPQSGMARAKSNCRGMRCVA